MKRIVSLLLVMLLLISSTALASEIPQIDSSLFLCAKQAVGCIVAGEYERMITLLPFSDVSPSASEWQSFVKGNFMALPEIAQSIYSVAYWTGSVWKLAVPVSEPASDDVETLVLTSPDGLTFSGYGYAAWADVKNEYLYASYVTWDIEYLDSTPIIAVD